jgi:hypothetical protein
MPEASSFFPAKQMPQNYFSYLASISTAMGSSKAPQRPERNTRASTVSGQTGETDAFGGELILDDFPEATDAEFLKVTR